MSAPPYMKLYVADYLGDTHHLSVVEHGAYLLLLMAMWRAGGSLPSADANLAKLARCTPDQWAEIRDGVLAFFRRRGGRITHKRIAAEMAKYESTSGKRSVAGKRGGRQKVNKINDQEKAKASFSESKPEAIADITRTRTIDSSEDKSSDADASNDLDGSSWRAAVKVLTEQGSMTEKPARSFFGKLLSENRLEARDLLPALTQAMVNRTQDPQGYLRRAASGVSKRRTDTTPKRVGFV